MEYKDIPYQAEINTIAAIHVSSRAKKYIREVLGMDPYKSRIAFHGEDIWVWNSKRVECFTMKEANEALNY